MRIDRGAVDLAPLIIFLVLLNEALGLISPSGEAIVHGSAMLGLAILGSAALVASKRN